MIRRRLLAAGIAAAAAAGCLHLGGPEPLRGTYPERIETFARLLRMEDTRWYEPLLTGRASASPDPWLRMKAALTAGRLRDADASPFLAVLLGDPEPRVRRAAAFSSGVLGDRRIVRFVERALADADGETAAEAAEALGKIGGEEALGALLAAAASPAGPRAAVGLALFRFPEERVVRALAPLARERDPTVRRAALYALARKPRPEALPMLREALSEERPELAAYAARALGILADAESIRPLVAAGRRPETSPAVQALLALEKIGAKAPLGADARELALARSADPLPGVAIAAVRLLARFPGDAEARTRLEGLISGGGWRGQTALVSLATAARATPERTTPERVATSKESSSPAERDSVMEALRRALSSSSLELRLGAAEAVGVLADEPAGELLRLLLADRSARVRALAIGSATKPVLGAHPELVLTALGDADAAVASSALEAAAPLPWSGPRSRELEEAWRRAYDAMFRAGAPDYAVGALDAAAARPDGGRALIEARVNDPDACVREKARRLMVEKLGAKPPFLRMAVKTRLSPKDYERLARMANESVLFATVRLASHGGGELRIELAAEEAPMTVASYADLARRRFFDGNVIHRVVPDFVVQAGDPRGDGTGGPGYAIRDELNRLRYRRGAVGMALSGPDTGGSQWFIALAPQPHLDGGYTVFGSVVAGMPAADLVEQDDVIARIEIDEKPREGRPPGARDPAAPAHE